MENNKRIMKKVKIILAILLSLIVVLSAAFAIYVNIYYHAENVDSYLTSDTNVTIEETSFGWFFDGPGNNEALIFYPGAKVEACAYAPLMKMLSSHGIDCFLVKMPFNLAFFGINKADKIMNYYSYDKWYISGHSLGGAMAASYTAKHKDRLSGLVLLASYSTGDLSDAAFPVLSIYGSNDGVLNKDKVSSARSLMPSAYSEYIIKGGNHAGFGSYGTQKGDNNADITNEEQWEITCEYILKSLNR